MLRSLILPGAILAVVACGGCSQSTDRAMIETPGRISLTTLGPALPSSSMRPSGIFRLGAGDSLGEEIFINYIASLSLPDTDEFYVEAIGPASETTEE